jgi:hypothetical protein
MLSRETKNKMEIILIYGILSIMGVYCFFAVILPSIQYVIKTPGEVYKLLILFLCTGCVAFVLYIKHLFRRHQLELTISRLIEQVLFGLDLFKLTVHEWYRDLTQNSLFELLKGALIVIPLILLYATAFIITYALVGWFFTLLIISIILCGIYICHHPTIPPKVFEDPTNPRFY